MSMSNCLANRYFLVVDDEEFVRTLVARFLKQSGAARVVEAGAGSQAIAAIASYEMHFDAVITDIAMRPMNGLELLRAIRTGTGHLKRNMPVLMLTAHAESEFVAEALALDADAFVVKPVGREALIERVVRVLDHVVTIQPMSAYAAVGAGGTVAVDPLLGQAPSRPGEPGDPVGAAEHVALDLVKANSILAQDIRLGEGQKLLLGAPVILTEPLLERLKDLRYIHNGYSHLWVLEPRSQDEESALGWGAPEPTATERGVTERMVGDFLPAPVELGSA